MNQGTCTFGYNIVHVDTRIHVYALMIFDTLTSFQASFKIVILGFGFLTRQCVLRF